MTNKHTPGTWHYDPDLLAVVVVNGHKVKAVADFWKCDLQENEANARLIAAAPDLLAALEYWFDSKATPSEIATRARAAIAKATGG